MTIHDVEQGSPEWYKVRLGMPTASEFHNLVTPLWKPRTGDGVNSYLARKLAEKWLQRPLGTFSGGAMENGSIREDEAVPWYEFETGHEVKRVGFVVAGDGLTGCSPDGIISGSCGFECKCPEPQTHIRYLLDGVLPSEYAPQVYGGMLVTGFEKWMFMSYCRGLPPLIVAVDRDESIMDKIESAIAGFIRQFDAAWARLESYDNEKKQERNREPASNN